MAEPNFLTLRQRLLESGVASRHAVRIVQELEDHYLDLCADYRATGLSPTDAYAAATAQLGSLEVVAESVKQRKELRQWCYRYPLLGRALLPLACLLALPAVPLVVGAGYVPAIARWSAILSASAIVTAAIFLVMQMTIALA